MTQIEAEPKIRLDLAERSYDIHVTSHLLARAGALIRPHLATPRLLVVADASVADLYGAALAQSLADAGIDFRVIRIAPGEGSKSFAQLESLLSALLDLAPERSTALLAFGGGVVGDLTGFAASILLRGVPFLQMPTTLLSQVDSSVGGKTGINMKQGKNLVGSFYQPRLVLADIDLLDSLPARELVSGYGEVVKYGLIDDASFFGWLEEHGATLLRGDRALRRQAVEHCCRAKARIVAGDERERGSRALLNLGHTFGHALEAETGFSATLLHGEAVALGCLMAFGLSVRLDLCPPEDFLRLCRHLHQVGLPTALPPGPDWDAKKLVAHFAHDKKVKDGRLTFILARGIGQSFVSHDVPPDILHELLEDWIEDSRENSPS
jgi:3-dehydroquinate synthase